MMFLTQLIQYSNPKKLQVCIYALKQQVKYNLILGDIIFLKSRSNMQS